MRRIVLLFVGIVLIVNVCVSCNRFPFISPIDPESDSYIGYESHDNDGDGIGQWEDVDEIELIEPEDGETVTTLPLYLCTNKFNPDKIAKYWIQISTSDIDFSGSIVYSKEDFTSNECSLPHGVVEVDVTYYWRAKAFDGSKWSDNWSEIRSFVIDVDTSVPWFPSPVDGAVILDTTPLLDWEDVSGVTGYYAQLNTNDNFTGTMIGEDSALATSEYQVGMLLADNTTYFWRVKTKNVDGVWSGWSNVWSFTVDIASPASPSPSSGTATTDTTPLLDWEDVAGASEYHIQVNTNNDFSGVMIAEDSTLSMSRYNVVTTLSDNTTYHWHVKVSNTDGVWGDWSSTWSFLVDTSYSKIAFSTNRSGQNRMWLMNPDGTGPFELTALNADRRASSWSPDMTKIAYRGCFGDPDDTWDVLYCNADGSGETRLTYHSSWKDLDPDWSPDGNEILFSSNRDGNWEVYIMNLDGSGQTNLTNNSTADGDPDWFPDGSKFVFYSERYTSTSEICVWDSETVTRITSNSANDSDPQWSPDGTTIAFVSDRDGNLEIYVMNADGSDQIRLTNDPAVDAFPQWSPDGSKISFYSRRDGDAEIFIMNADGSGLINLTNNDFWDYEPCW